MDKYLRYNIPLINNIKLLFHDVLSISNILPNLCSLNIMHQHYIADKFIFTILLSSEKHRLSINAAEKLIVVVKKQSTRITVLDLRIYGPTY